jgi:hypothetical protein
MKIKLSKSLVVVALAAAFSASTAVRAADAASEPLKLNLPAHTLKGTPEDLPVGPHVEPPPKSAPPTPAVPKGVVNVAAGKAVTSSVPPFLGELSQITDGKREAFDEDAVEFKKGTQWAQVDLPCGTTTVTCRPCTTSFSKCPMIPSSRRT